MIKVNHPTLSKRMCQIVVGTYLHQAYPYCDGASHDEVVGGDPLYPVDAAGVADVAGVVANAAEATGADAARVGDLDFPGKEKNPFRDSHKRIPNKK